jgi:hypothetical protein
MIIFKILRLYHSSSKNRGEESERRQLGSIITWTVKLKLKAVRKLNSTNLSNLTELTSINN